ncbi:MAG: SDR family oxidoreductase [Planctomycetes bacterium]|nr:SDR family oxidoreductase [Planctomycetota bacterium]
MTQPVALVTGAGSGIGRETAIQLSKLGYRVVLAGRRVDALRETASMLAGPRAEVGADLGEAIQAEKLVDYAVETFGRLDAVINNAGWSIAATIPQTNAALVQRVFAVNAIAPAIIIARAWPILERQARAEGKGGVFVNVSSMATVDPFESLYAYAAAKSAVNSLARSVAKAGRALGIRGFAIAPGAVETPLLRSIVGIDQLPTEQTLSPESVARLIVDCVTGKRDQNNGETILMPSP